MVALLFAEGGGDTGRYIYKYYIVNIINNITREVNYKMFSMQ